MDSSCPPAAAARCGATQHSISRRCARRAAFAALCVALITPLQTTSASDALSLAEAERRSLARDADLVRLEAERQALLEASVAAAELPDPRVRMGAVNVPTDSFSLDAEDMTMVELGVSQMFPPGDTRELAAQRAQRGAEALEARIADRRRVVVRELRKAWIADAALRGAAELIEEQIAWFDPLVANAVVRYGNAQLRQLDVLSATLEQAELRQRLLELKSERAAARAMLGRWLGEPPAPLTTALPAPREWPPLAALQAALVAHPTRIDFERRIDALETSERLEQQKYRPDWELDFSYGLRSGRGMDGEPRSDMVTAMVSFSLPLFAGDRQDRSVAAARAETRSLRAMHDDHERELEAALVEALDVARAAREIEQLFDSSLISLSQQAAATAVAAYANDTAEFAELIETGTALLALKLRRIEAAAQRARADADVAYLVGETP